MEAEALTWVEVAGSAEEPAPLPAPSVPAERIELVLASGMTVRVPTRFDVEALRRLLTVVG